MKNKIAIASAAFVAASSFSTAEIVVNDFLSFEGFVDMSYVYTSTETGDNKESDNSYQIDQVEISWLFDFDPVTAQIDIQYEDPDGNDTDEIEQAFVTYHFDNGGAITAGRYASMLGFEAFEPTGLYQYSFAYDMENRFPGFLPGYAQGVKYTHEGDATFFGISLQDEAFDTDANRLGGASGPGADGTWALEVAGAYYMDNGLSFFLGGAYEEGEDSSDTYVINTYATFETGAWIFAAELNYGETENNKFLPGLFGIEEEIFAALLMANFAYSDAASITGRLSYIDGEKDSGIGEEEYFKYTLAHGYAFTDNLFLVTELSYVDGELNGTTDFDALEAAVELIFSF